VYFTNFVSFFDIYLRYPMQFSLDTLRFDTTTGLIPAVIQDKHTRTVLMVGYMNREALSHTLATGIVTFFSRSKQRLWTKGETSGNVLRIADSPNDILTDCDHDTLLIFAEPAGPTCHTGEDSCFGLSNTPSAVNFLTQLQRTIHERKQAPASDSYTAKLFAKGINKIAQKVGEEAVELVIEAKDDNQELFLGEAADLLFHTLVLLSAKNHSLEDVVNVLRSRHR
jgi:phosphoribosyl-AMP cyclohydrolase / phosphoribosyl-ATP pyrophosphohydrolase